MPISPSKESPTNSITDNKSWCRHWYGGFWFGSLQVWYSSHFPSHKRCTTCCGNLSKRVPECFVVSLRRSTRPLTVRLLALSTHLYLLTCGELAAIKSTMRERSDTASILPEHTQTRTRKHDHTEDGGEGRGGGAYMPLYKPSLAFVCMHAHSQVQTLSSYYTFLSFFCKCIHYKQCFGVRRLDTILRVYSKILWRFVSMHTRRQKNMWAHQNDMVFGCCCWKWYVFGVYCVMDPYNYKSQLH